MRISFGSKARVLEQLAGRLKTAKVLPQAQIAWSSWQADPSRELKVLSAKGWEKTPLIVRSSAAVEDQANATMAGRFLSIPNVLGMSAIQSTVDRVFQSFGPNLGDADVALIQPYLSDIEMAGVAFSRDPNTGGPYIVVNYEVDSDGTGITSGHARNARTFYFWKDHSERPDSPLGAVIGLARELEDIFGHDALDIEFAFSKSEGLCLLQVRPLPALARSTDVTSHAIALSGIAKLIEETSRPHPYLSGKRSVFGIMPDWNPAEIIGVRPRPLALSLYRSLITDQIWAYQRSNYGYKNLRSFPLMLSFHGLPYIDARVSFNSFVPADIRRELSDRLVDYYIDRLTTLPSLHDKIEFEIVFSCYTLDLPDRLQALKNQGFTDHDLETLQTSLRKLTNRIIHGTNGLWREDAAKIEELSSRRVKILNSELDPAARVYWLLEDCKRWGTLPFAGLARAGFIAMQMLKSMMSIGVIDAAQYDQFMASTDTVTRRLIRDMITLRRDQFLEKYGHLRPGTYDILSPRYDETPDQYLGEYSTLANEVNEATELQLSLGQMKQAEELLRVHGLDMDVVGLFDFMKAAIQWRELSKFEFTRSLSDALTMLTRLGDKCGLTPDDISFADIRVIEELIVSSGDHEHGLKRSIEQGRSRYAETCRIVLPPLIVASSQVWGFELSAEEPSFITQKTAIGHVCSVDGNRATLKDGIVFIENADPGYDWIFTQGIRAFVTAYGGVNSHMAIRAGECGIPAVIGAGEQLFRRWKTARRLRIDCCNRRVEALG